LSEKDVKLLTPPPRHELQPAVGKTIKQLKNFSKCLDSLIQADSMLAINFQGFIKNVEDNEESYESNQAINSLFCLAAEASLRG
jgi:hypothetical protein